MTAGVTQHVHQQIGSPVEHRRLVAEAIIERARAAGIYVHESPQLVALLMQTDLDDYIPPQLYGAVAELLAWLYRLEHDDTVSAAPPPD